jgi:hypothetical protein
VSFSFGDMRVLWILNGVGKFAGCIALVAMGLSGCPGRDKLC